MDSSDEFLAVVADLLSEPRYEPFLVELFALAPGRWATLQEIASVTPEILPAVRGLTAGGAPKPVITWLDDPHAASRNGYALVIAYWDAEGGVDSVARFNKAALEGKIAARRANLSLIR